jgi:hypothetical protein
VIYADADDIDALVIEAVSQEYPGVLGGGLTSGRLTLPSSRIDYGALRSG